MASAGRKLGGLWKGQTRDGRPKISGRFRRDELIEALRAIQSDAVVLSVFPNDYKKEDLQPDHVVYLYAYIPQGNQPAERGPAPATTPARAAAQAPPPSADYPPAPNPEDYGYRVADSARPAPQYVPAGGSPPPPDDPDQTSLFDDDDLPF